MSSPQTAFLQAEIEAYQPADAAEREHRSRFLILLRRSDDAFRRSHFAPGHVTASAFIIHPPTATLLLHLHRRLGRWLQMGGHVDEGEHPFDAALREGREESGLIDLRARSEAIFDLDVHSIPAGRGEPPHLHFDVRYLFEAPDPEAIAMREDESRELRWFDLADAERAMNEEASTRVLRKIGRRLGR